MDHTLTTDSGVPQSERYGTFRVTSMNAPAQSIQPEIAMWNIRVTHEQASVLSSMSGLQRYHLEHLFTPKSLPIFDRSQNFRLGRRIKMTVLSSPA